MAPINNSYDDDDDNDDDDNNNNNNNNMYCKTHFYGIWQNRGYNTYKRAYISEYERINGVPLGFFGKYQLKTTPIVNCMEHNVSLTLIFGPVREDLSCPEGGLPLRLPAIFVWNLLHSYSSFWLAPWSPHSPHHPNFGLLFLFVCVSIQGHYIFVISVSATGIFCSGAIYNSHVTAGS